MKKIILFIIILFGTWNVYASPPTRSFTYVANTTIDPAQVNTNENSLYSYLQVGVDTYAASSITGSAISSSASIPYVSLSLSNSIVRGDISTSSFVTLPTGAVFFMLTGSCPTGTTDVSATYSNKFLRVNATAGSTGGADTHTHAAGSYAGPAHTHGITGTTSPNWAQDPGLTHAAGTLPSGTSTDSSGTGAVTGTSGVGDNVPAYVTAKLCKVS